MTPEEYRKWRPTYSAYDRNYSSDDGYVISDFRKFLALSGLALEASEAQGVAHKDYRNDRPLNLEKIKDELSDVWWYFNMCLDEFDLTLDELSVHNKQKLDKRNDK